MYCIHGWDWHRCYLSLTHWGRDKMIAISQTIFSNEFSPMDMYKFWWRFHWHFPKGPIDNIAALIQIMVWLRPVDNPLSGPMMVTLLTHICLTRPQCLTVLMMLAMEIKIHMQVSKWRHEIFVEAKLGVPQNFAMTHIQSIMNYAMCSFAGTCFIIMLATTGQFTGKFAAW